MPDVSGYDIFIWGGSETVAKGGRHLAEQSGELERIMNEFSREVSAEKDLFDQAVTEMEAQEGRSNKLSQEANYIASTRINEASSAVGEEINVWQDSKEQAENILSLAKNLKDTLKRCIEEKDHEIEDFDNQQSSAECIRSQHEGTLKCHQDYIAKQKEICANCTSETSFSTEKSRLEHAQQEAANSRRDIQADNDKIRRIQHGRHQCEIVRAKLQAFAGVVEAKITAAQNLLALAQGGLDTAHRHESQLNSQKDKANANNQKAAEANTADNNQLSAICHDRKVSAKQLDALQSAALDRQQQSTDMLAQECDVLQNVAERMALYEEFSFQ